MPTQARKSHCELESLVEAPEKIEYCANVRLDNTSNQQHLAVIVHPDSNKQEEACLLLLQYTAGADTPAVLDMMPISPDLIIDIAQTKSHDIANQTELLVTFTAKGKSFAVVFLEKQVMTDVLAGIRKRIASSISVPGSHSWAETYSTTTVTRPKPKRSNTTPIGNTGALQHVLPVQPDDTAVHMNRRRPAPDPSKKARELSTTEAKEHWISARLMDQEDNFVDWSYANIFAGTWNVHGCFPTESLTSWICDGLIANDRQPFEPDFYVIGLQEMDTSTGAYLWYDPTGENAWVEAIFKALGERSTDYYKVAAQQLVTMLIIVVGKKEHRNYISEVETSYAGVGLGNVMGNKGGTAVRFRFYDSYYCFVASHLAAFTDKIKKRNQDFLELSKRLVFPHRADPLTSYVHFSWNNGGDEGVEFLEDNSTVRDWKQEASVYHADHLIWLGDLNYRVNMTEPEIKLCLRKEQLHLLLEYDQLSIERQAGRAFAMFEEGEINFMPTYKFDAGTNEYDTSEKRRAPSWTDRILWKKEGATLSGQEKHEPLLELLAYESCQEMMLSDHKPVRALMRTKVRKIDSKKQSETRTCYTQKLVETEDNLTRGKISTSFVKFEDVHFMEYKEKTIVIENTGQVLAPFRFIPKNDEPEICPPWLQIHPLSGVLGPGEKTVVHFAVMIDSTKSAAFNAGKEKLGEIYLVLRLEQGKDFFIVISGNYIPTCFGVPLDRLAPMTVPVSQFEASKPRSAGPEVGERQEQQQQQQNQAILPKELWHVLNFLWNKNMLCIDSLFLNHGERVLSEYIRKCLDTGESFDSSVLLGNEDGGNKDALETGHSVSNEQEANAANSMVDVLVAFLECLPESVVPSSFYGQALECSTTEQMNQLRMTLPLVHGNVLLYVTSFLKDALRYAPESCREKRHTRIVELFTVLLRPSGDFKEHNPGKAKAMRERFVAQLLK